MAQLNSLLWLTQLKSKFDPPSKMWQVSKNVCNYRVPKPIVISNPQAYAPLVISFGPYPQKINNELSPIHQYKLEALHRTLERLQIDVNSLIAKINELESKIRDCYEEPIDWDGETLSWVFAIDACFILEWLRCSATPRGYSDIECFSLVFQRRGHTNTLHQAILNDILKLENQIPLFLLTTLLEMEFDTRERAIRELTKLLSRFREFHGFPFSFSGDDVELEDDEHNEKLKEHIKKNPFHLLDLYRMVIKDLLMQSTPELATTVEVDDYVLVQHHDFINMPSTPSADGSRSSRDDSRSTPSAEVLHKTGINFKPGQLGFREKKFGKGTLSLPQITVDDTTETMLRNLMAYEECQKCSWSPQETVISHFIRLLDDLIDSEKDVSLLRKSLVIRSWVGSDEDIASMFNRLGNGITFGSIQEFEVVMKAARDHYNSRRKVWMSQFKEEYCSKPWYFLSIPVAMYFLGTNSVQTVYSVKAYL